MRSTLIARFCVPKVVRSLYPWRHGPRHSTIDSMGIAVTKASKPKVHDIVFHPKMYSINLPHPTANRKVVGRLARPFSILYRQTMTNCRDAPGASGPVLQAPLGVRHPCDNTRIGNISRSVSLLVRALVYGCIFLIRSLIVSHPPD